MRVGSGKPRESAAKQSDSLLAIKLVLSFVFGALTLLAQPTFAQSFGSVLGTVSDPSGAVISGAKVTLTNLNTGDHRAATADTGGFYQFPNVLPGAYQIDVEHPGFRHVVRGAFQVTTLAAVRIDVQLVVGVVSQTVVVTAATPLIETDKSAVGTTIEQAEVQALPLNGRNPLSLAQLVPGVIPQNGAIGSAANPQGAGNFEIAGAFGNQSAEYLDGAPLNSPNGNMVSFVPPQDAVQEFRVSTSDADPEFGRSSGGSISMTIKSGTNDFHGTAYEYWRNRVLNANDFFAAQTNSPNPPFNQNQYGATLGGPIKKDKLFFFFSWESFALRLGNPLIGNVPTAAELTGDFSALPTMLPAGTNCDTAPSADLQGCIYDPITGKAFPNNKIPSSSFDSTANFIANIQKIWPAPNSNDPNQNYKVSASAGSNTAQYNARGDYNLSDKQRLFLRYTNFRSTALGFDPFGKGIGSAPTPAESQQVALGDNYVISPTTVVDAHLSFLRNTTTTRQIADKPSTDMSVYGPGWAFMNAVVNCKGSPALAIDGITWAGVPNCSNDTENVYSAALGVTKTFRGHTLKFGGEWRRLEYYFIGLDFPVGSYNFAASSTSGRPDPITGIGFGGVGFASFLLGQMQLGGVSASLTNGIATAGMEFYNAYYASDTFRVKSRLSVNLGVRYELPGGISEKKDRASVFLPNAPSPIFPQFKGEIALVNTPQWPYRINQKPQYHLFAPRVGLAYRFTNSLVARAGYGITYTPPDASIGLEPYNAAINVSSTSPYGPSLSNPFPNGIVTAPGRNSSVQTAFLGQSFLFPSPGVYPNTKYPYVQQWNLNIQKQFGQSAALQIGYVGSKGTQLPTLLSFENQLPDQYDNIGVSNPVCNPFSPSPATCGLFDFVQNPMFGGPFPSTAAPLITGPFIPYGVLLKPEPQFFPWVTVQNQSFGSSIYHSLQASFRKEFGSGGVISAAYTWSKLISNVDTTTPQNEGVNISIGGGNMGGQDAYNPRAERGVVRYDIPQRLVVSYDLNLPFGKGKRWMGSAEGPVNKIVSGWAVTGITTFQSGIPLIIQTVNPSLGPLPLEIFMGITPFGLRPNVVPGCKKSMPGSVGSRLNEYFNTACFTQPPVVGFGNPFGNQPFTDPHLRAQGIANFDFSAVKDTPINNRFGLEFRAEMFNIFDRTQFAPPGGLFNPLTLGQPGDTFGKVTQTAAPPRQIQLALRLRF